MHWKAEPIIHNSKARIALHFDYSKAANERVQKLAGAKWSSTLKAWHVPDNISPRCFSLKGNTQESLIAREAFN